MTSLTQIATQTKAHIFLVFLRIILNALNRSRSLEIFFKKELITMMLAMTAVISDSVETLS